MSRLERIAKGAALKRAGSDTLTLIFSSRLAPAFVDFDFKGLAGRLDSSVLLLRDDSQRFYFHRGVEGLGESARDACSAIDGIRQDVGASRIVTCGSSWGGHGAALYAQLLDAELGIVVNGLSFLDPRIAKAKGGGQRVPGSFRTMGDLYAGDPEAATWLDLRAVTAARGPGRPSLRWHYGAGDRIDRIHAAHMEGADGVELISHGGSFAHGQLSGYLLFSGILKMELERRPGR